MKRWQVAVVKGEYEEAKATTKEAVRMAGGWEETIAGAKRVFLKPNLTVPSASGKGVVTDVRVVEALIELLREAGVPDIRVGDGPGGDEAADCFRAAGYDRLPGAYGVTLVDLNRAATRLTPVKKGKRYQELEIPIEVPEADAFISISLLKTHTDGHVTITAKNMFGVPPNRFYGRPRYQFHKRGVHEVIYDINQAVTVHFAVVDGLVGMEEAGPIYGKPVKLCLVIAGANLVAVDAVCCHLMGIDPRQVLHLVYLWEAGRGPLDLAEIEVVGEPIEKVGCRFALPPQGLTTSAQRLSGRGTGR